MSLSGRGQNFSADPARYRLIFDIAGCIDTRVSDFEKLSAPLPGDLLGASHDTGGAITLKSIGNFQDFW